VIGKTICFAIAESCSIERIPREEAPENELI